MSFASFELLRLCLNGRRDPLVFVKENFMTETTLTEFDKSIGCEESFWNDYNLEVSSELLDQFSISDWEDLKQAILTRPKYWQERCAEAIGYMENKNGVDLLISFLESPYMSVAAIAASELDNMSISLPRVLEKRLLEILKYLEENNGSRREDVQELIFRLV